MVDYERKVQGFLDNKNKDLTSSATRQKVWSSIRGKKKQDASYKLLMSTSSKYRNLNIQELF